MAKSISVKPKKRGRPKARPAGVYPLVGVRMPPESREEIEAWAADQKDKPSLSEAIRRLIEEALAKRKARRSPK